MSLLSIIRRTIKFLSIILIVIPIFSLDISVVSAQLPFGGQIQSIFFCTNGWNVVVGPPVGGSYFYQPGLSYSYEYGPPVATQQWLLGLWGAAMVCLVPCPTGTCPDPTHSGLLILFHGSSLPGASAPGSLEQGGTDSPADVPNNPGLETVV